MNHSHSTSNSPALPGGGPPGGAGGYPPGPYPPQHQLQSAGRQDMAGAHPSMMYMQPNSSMPYGAGIQQPQFIPGYNPMMQRPPTMINSQIPQQQQQQMLQQQQQYVAQMRQPMVPGPRYPSNMPPFQPQAGYIQQQTQQDQPVYHQLVSPQEMAYHVPNMHPQVYQHMQIQQQQQRPDVSMGAARPPVYGGPIPNNNQSWQMYAPAAPMNQLYQPVVRTRPVARPMMPPMPQTVAMQPQELTNESAVAISQMNVPETVQMRPAFVQRSGTVYYTDCKPDAEDKAHAVKHPPRKVLQIIDPDTGKNVLDSLDANQRPASDEALQIQSEFSKMVTQRIAQGDKASDLNEYTEHHHRYSTGTLLPKLTKPLVEKEDLDQADDRVLSLPTVASESVVKPEAVKAEEVANDVELGSSLASQDLRNEVDSVASETEPTDSGVDLPLESGVDINRGTREDLNELPEVKTMEKQSVAEPEDNVVEIEEKMEERLLPVESLVDYPEIEAAIGDIKHIEGNLDVVVSESTSELFVQPPEGDGSYSPIQETKAADEAQETEPHIETVEKELEHHDDEATEVEKNGDDATLESSEAGSKYSYEPGQWSPMTPDGKKVYSRDFLLQLQYIPESTQTPPGLPNLPEIIRSSMPARDSVREHSFSSLSSSVGFDFMPRYAHERASVGKAPIKRNSFQKRNEPPVKIITIHRSEDVQLHKTEQAWKPAVISHEPSNPEANKTEELYKKMRGILNKITPSTFDRLINQVSELPIDDETRLSGCIKILFEKAISEPKFVKAYSTMAHRLSSHNVQCDDNPEKKVSFRKLLLNRCQEEFEKDKEDELDIERREKEIEETTKEDKKKILIEAKNEAITKSRRRSLGNIRFIGELFKLKMLTEAIMHDCIKKLLNAEDEDSLELLCNLLTTIGKELETDKARKSMDSYFTKLSSKKGLPPRIRFMIQDLCELRESKWVPRRAENIPKTIDQIHQEAHEEKEQAKLQMLTRTSIPPPKPRQDRRLAGPASSLEKDEGWSTAIGSGSRTRIDANKMLKIAKSMKDDVSLAPQFAPSWQKGSSGIGSRGSSQEGEKPLMPTNRYTALENLGASGPDVTERNSRFANIGRNSSHVINRQLLQSSIDNRKVASVSQDRARNSSQDRVEGQSSIQSQPQGAVSVPSLTTIDKETEKKPQLNPRVELSREEIERQAANILEEYFAIEDMKEASMCVEELKSPKSLYAFVSFAINFVLEKKPHIMNLMGSLLSELLTNGMLSTEQFEKGIKEVLEEAENLAVDIPRFWEYLGEILASTTRANHQLWHLLRFSCDQVATCGKSENLFRRTIKAVSDKEGCDKTCEALRKSKLRWSNYVGEGLFGYTRQHKLEHLDPVREELIALMKEHEDNQPIFDWIQRNVSESEAESREFVRALVTAVCSCALTASDSATSEDVSYVVSEERIVHRTTLLQRFLDHKPNHEIQALYALQALMHGLEHPPNILNTFFEILYDKEIIAEDAFWDWKSSKDPAEQTGQGVALQSVRAFFDWLEEATEEQTTS